MNCPVCDNVRMREVSKDNIVIDVCPSCKGVWLDRGELEKLTQGIQEIREPFNQFHEDYERKQSQSNDHNRSSKYPDQKYKKKKSMLDVFGDLFE
jgi:Zn-finger nucleic acid-binding protein